MIVVTCFTPKTRRYWINGVICDTMSNHSSQATKQSTRPSWDEETMPYRKCRKLCIVDGDEQSCSNIARGKTFFCCFSLFRHGTMRWIGAGTFPTNAKQRKLDMGIGHVVIADGDGIIKKWSRKRKGLDIKEWRKRKNQEVIDRRNLERHWADARERQTAMETKGPPI